MNISHFPQFSFYNSNSALSNAAYTGFIRTSFIKICALLCLFVLVSPLSVQAESVTALSSSTVVKVNINTADTDELSSRLFGIGESKAQAIVDYREQIGTFKSVNDLILVRGIGEKTLVENQHLLSVTNE